MYTDWWSVTLRSFPPSSSAYGSTEDFLAIKTLTDEQKLYYVFYY